jgi:hypothetical protein
MHASMQWCTLTAGSPSISSMTGASRQAADWPPPACARQRAVVCCGARYCNSPASRAKTDTHQHCNNGNGRFTCVRFAFGFPPRPCEKPAWLAAVPAGPTQIIIQYLKRLICGG